MSTTNITVHEVPLEGMRHALLEIIDAHPDRVGRISFDAHGYPQEACIYFHDLRVTAPIGDVPTTYAGEKTNPMECEPCCIVGTYLKANPVLLEDPSIIQMVFVNSGVGDVLSPQGMDGDISFGTDTERYDFTADACQLLQFAQELQDGKHEDGSWTKYRDIRNVIEAWQPEHGMGH